MDKSIVMATQMTPRCFILLGLALLASACTTLSQRQAVTTPPPAVEVPPPSHTEEAQTQPSQDDAEDESLSTELIFNTLAGEIAAQRGENQLGYNYALRAAEQSLDPSAAETATQMALKANLPREALEAANLWIDLEPESSTAHQIAALLNARQDNMEQAARHLRAVIRLGELSEHNGYLQAAAIAEKIGDPDKALQLMQMVIPADNLEPNALLALAITATSAKQFTLAEETIRKALQVNPQDLNSLLLLSQSLRLQHRDAESLEVLHQAVESAPDNINLRLNYAKTLVEVQRMQDALEQFEILDSQQPETPDFIFALGLLNFDLGKLDDAIRHFEQLLKLGKRSMDARYHLGLIAEQQKNHELAMEYFGQITGNRQFEAHMHIAHILADTGRLPEALSFLQTLRSDSTGPESVRLYLAQAELLRNVNRYKDAQSVYDQGLIQHANDPDLLYARGLNAVEIGRLDILERDLRQLLKAQPDNADALNALGYTLADQTNRYDEARALITRALELKPNNPAILDSIGWLEYRVGNLEQSMRYLQQAVQLNPDAEIAAHLGEVLWRLNMKGQAMEVWNKANQSFPDNRYIPPVMQRLGAGQ